MILDVLVNDNKGLRYGRHATILHNSYLKAVSGFLPCRATELWQIVTEREEVRSCFSRNRVREVTLRSWTQAHAKHHSLSLCLCASLSPNPPADWPELGLLVWAGSLPHDHSALIWAACLHAARLNTSAAPCQRRSGSHCHPWERQLEVVCTWMGTSQLGRGERKGHHGSCSGHMGRIH